MSKPKKTARKSRAKAEAPAIIALPRPSPRCEAFGDATLWLGDMRDVMPTLGNVTHVITDPPYESSLHDSKGRAAGRLRTDGRAHLQALDFAPIDEIRGEVVRLVEGSCSGWFLVFCTVEGVAKWADAINPSRIKYKRACVWIKPDSTPQLNAQGPAQGAEMFVSAWAGKGHARWNAGGKRGVYTHSIRQSDRYTRGPETKGGHPTEKPVALMREIVVDFTKPGDLVRDPFMGLGTTGVAALAFGRRFVGVELRPEWFDVACRRVEAAARQPDLFIPPVGLRHKERRAMAPEMDLQVPAPHLLAPISPSAAPMHHKADGGQPQQVDLEDYLKGDRRTE